MRELKKKPGVNTMEKRCAALLPPAALPHRRYMPHRDRRLGSPPCLTAAVFNASNLVLDAIMITEHNIGIQLGM